MSSELGQLWQFLPIGSLSSSVSLPTAKSTAGRKGWLNVSQAIALMFLKHHQNQSDAKTIKNLNTNSDFQLFCGVVLQEGERIKDMTLLSSWRSKFGHHMDTNFFQSILQHHWKPYLSDKQICKMDASCVESYITYPTSVKLLWGAYEWVYRQIVLLCKCLKLPLPRSRFKEQKQKQRAYQLLKKPAHKQRIKRQKALLNHLIRMLMQLDALSINGTRLSTPKQAYLKVVKEMLQQQKFHFNEPESKIENRIVSLHKPYVRPIVRGKENKPVEFGAKVHFYQVDNFEFIEYVSFDAFNETTRFESAINHQQDNIGTVKAVAADKIYHTNKNRNTCTEMEIQNNFAPKGKPPKDENRFKKTKKLKEMLSVDRGTRLEGAFGNIKNHYGARANKARTKDNEIVWIFFSVHAANASKIAQIACK